MRFKRRVSNIVLVAILSISIIFQMFYIDHLKVQAAEVVVGGVVAGETLLEFIIGVAAIGLCAYCGYQSEDIYGDSSPLQIGREFANWTNTFEGSMAMKDYVDKLDWEVLQGGKGGPEPPKDPLNTEIVGIAYDVALVNLLFQFFDYLEDNGKLEYLDQEITYNSVLPDWFRVGERNSSYDSVMYENGYFLSDTYFQTIDTSSVFIDVSLLSNSDKISFYFYPTDSKGTLYSSCAAYRDGYTLVSTFKNQGGNFDLVNGSHLCEMSYWRVHRTGGYLVGSGSSSSGHIVNFTVSVWDVYTGGNFFYEDLEGNVYYVDLDGMVYDADGNVLSSSLTTEEGYLKSVKAITKTGISDFYDDLSESIAESNPEVPTLTKQQINRIYESVSNYYEQVTHNYYEDTTYIEGDTYIEEVTNIFNEVVESPSLPPYVPDIPGLSDNYRVVGLDSVFPFCIPFDIYEMVSIFAADPVAPSFDWVFDFGILGEYTINIDLSVFDPIAEIFRTFEFFIFMLSILILTRDNMIKG